MRYGLGSLALAAALIASSDLRAADADKKQSTPSFGALTMPSQDAARAQAEGWLKSKGKTDADSLKAFETIWSEDRTVLDKIADTFALGDPTAAKLLADARDPSTTAPIEVPAIIRDTKQPAFFRSNLALAYAKALTGRRIYEESLEALKAVKVENVVDPASFLFTRAVAEHALIQRNEADETIIRLLDDVPDAPERYKMVAALMHFDMLTWKDKDLGWIARKMDNIERRLDLSRGGPTTQKMQKEVVMRLDEIIKELENRKKGNGNGNGGNCPNGGQGGNPGNNIQSSSPQQDSMGGNGTGPGTIDPKKVKEIAEAWGKLPEKERAKALIDLTRDMPPRYREVIESYFKKINPETGTK